MFAPRHDFFRTIGNARRATRRGDYAEAERWTRLAERHLAIAERMTALSAAEKAAAKPPETRTGPVMLDPKGFSPSGIPNWALNRDRLARAGIRPPQPWLATSATPTPDADG